MSDDDDYGDEGFDDYDEEFEDFEEDEGKQSQESKHDSGSTAASSEFVASPSSGGKISSFELNRRRQRAKDIRSLVSLSAESSDLISLSKLSPYDYYLRCVKNGALKQSSQQTNADNRGVKLQTDSISKASKTCQVPDDLGFSASSNGAASVANAMALVKFLKRAYPVCETVLDANVPASDAAFDDAGRGSDFSTSSVSLVLPEALGDRQAVATVASGRSLSEFLVAYNRPSWAAGPGLAEGFEGASPKASESKEEAKDDTNCLVPESGLLCLWDAARSTKIPDKVFVCEGEITSCAISPDRGELVVAATREGSLFLWDLREDAQVRMMQSAVKFAPARPGEEASCVHSSCMSCRSTTFLRRPEASAFSAGSVVLRTRPTQQPEVDTLPVC